MRALYNLHIPFAIAFLAFVVLFAIIYPLLMRIFARKYFSWLGSLISIAIFAALMAVYSFTAVGTFLSLR